MISAFDKRPTARGRTHSSKKIKTAPAYVKWVRPGNAFVRVLLIILAIIPFVGLSTMGWLQIKEGYVVEGEKINVKNLELLTDAGTVGGIISERVFAPNIDVDGVQSAEFLTRFNDFSIMFPAIAGTMAVSLFMLVLSIGSCKSKVGAVLAYSGFFFGVLPPVLLIYTVTVINSMAGQNIVRASVYPYLALLSGLLALVYCVRYPIVSNEKKKRNSIFTRALVSLVPVKGDGFFEGLRKAIFTGALVCFLYFSSTLGVDLFKEWQASLDQKRTSEMRKIAVDINDPAYAGFQNRKNRPLSEYLALWNENNDMVGYITIGNTKVDYPVLQTTNNDYYLENDFNRNASDGGAVFADFNNRFDELDISGNTIIYGHNNYSGSYLTAISNYHRKTVDGTLSFYKENPVVQFDTLYQKMEWKVFACVLFNTKEEHGEVYDYWLKYDFEDRDDFNGFILDIMDRSVLFTDVDLEYGDNILTLSTCHFPYGTNVETRCVVFARQVRSGEDPYVNVEKATYNPYIIRFAEEARRIGNTWKGRVWDTSYLKGYSE